MEYYSAINRKEILPSPTIQMDPEGIMLTEVRERQISNGFIDKLNFKQTTATPRYREQTGGSKRQVDKTGETFQFSFSSVAQSCPTICDFLNHSTPGLPVHQQLPEFAQIHVHRVDEAIQPSHPLLSPSPPAPNLSQDQGLFQ